MSARASKLTLLHPINLPNLGAKEALKDRRDIIRAEMAGTAFSIGC